MTNIPPLENQRVNPSSLLKPPKSSPSFDNGFIRSFSPIRRRTTDETNGIAYSSSQNETFTTDASTTRQDVSIPVVCMEQRAPNNTEIEDDLPYSMKTFSRRKQGNKNEDKKLSRRVRRFYRKQDELIDTFERVNNYNEDEADKRKVKAAKQEKMSNILTNVSLAVNILLFLTKIVAAVLSKSLSVVSSVIDSAVDLASSVALLWASRARKKKDPYNYPQGRTRLEPIAIIILSVIMCAASVLVIYESLNTIVQDVQYFHRKPNSTISLPKIDMSAAPISIMAITA
ncbi:unnamed protein product, partial [Didymodactylos carnosus]